MSEKIHGDKCPFCGNERNSEEDEYDEGEYTIHYSCYNEHEWWDVFDYTHFNTTTEDIAKHKPNDLCPYCSASELTKVEEIYGKKGYNETADREHFKIFNHLGWNRDDRKYLQDDKSEFFDSKIFHCNNCNKSFMKVYRYIFSYSDTYDPEEEEDE